MVRPPAYRDEIMKVINLHEFEDAAKKSLSVAAYDYVAAGAGDELTLRANREAFGHYWVRRKVMVDVSKVDTSLELLGQKLDHPILLGPGGGKNIVDRRTASAVRRRPRGSRRRSWSAARSRCSPRWARRDRRRLWWGATLGEGTQAQAVEFAKRSEDAGASALCVTVDYPYTGARDRPSRDQWDPEWARTRVYGTPEFRVGFQAGMLDPYTPNLTWEWMKWVRPADQAADRDQGDPDRRRRAARRRKRRAGDHRLQSRRADARRHGRHARRACRKSWRRWTAEIPVLVDGGIRRGGDVIKALALGAKAILIGRPFLWGLAAFGQEGVQRVVELLHGELRIALGLSGAGNLKALDRSFIRPAWKAYNGLAPPPTRRRGRWHTAEPESRTCVHANHRSTFGSDPSQPFDPRRGDAAGDAPLRSAGP